MNPDLLLSRLLPHWPGVLFQQRPDGSFDYISPQIEAWTGLPAANWQADPALFWGALHETDVPAMRSRLHTPASEPCSLFRLRHPVTGRVIHIREFRQPVYDAKGLCIGSEGFWEDITVQSRGEKRLTSAVWKDTLTAVTLGFAHDFNNLLTGVLSLSESYLAQIDEQHPLCEGLALIRNNSRQATQLVQRLVHLHYDRPGTRSYQDLNTIISDTNSVLRRVVSRRYELSTQLAATALPLYVDPVELRQAIITLALNAVERIGDRGVIVLETSRQTRWPEPPDFKGVPPRLPAVNLTITGRSTGLKSYSFAITDPCLGAQLAPATALLGVKYARDFAERHEGGISVGETDELRFELWLPESDFSETENLPGSGAVGPSLLVVGSDRAERLRIAELLRQQNFRVVTAGDDAIEVLQNEDYRFDAVLLQVTPGDGEALSLIGYMRKLKLPLKAVVRLVGCKADALSPTTLAKADMILPPELPEQRIAEKLGGLWAAAPR